MCKTFFISGILMRRGMQYRKRILTINNILKDKCLELGFIFMNNDNVVVDQHLLEDGLHLNTTGVVLFRSNLVNILY